MSMLIGILSDTHGYVSDSVMDALVSVDHIVHAGDICDETTLPLLETIASVTAVRGNCDRTGSTATLPAQARLHLAGTSIVVEHRLTVGPSRHSLLSPGTLHVSGHTHVPMDEVLDRVRYINPGSATHGRSAAGETIALLQLTEGEARLTFVSV